ncbi:hypothetical protein M409DRAFT_28419 [Zasmidium cellare ATCC 36951]|uniref:RNA helicase n=1 Tax=Zasmidium cellare ATCC 36951 TaxID=1080233 RepID=A0A6A6C466_ZASCE|nr:uncharacterized protein M409DRAFT_28419 [Zasmidium cellare ATCC 36951]KAF2161088.1 hypothetical protein M409DRAFT_28419 [Zasmidium cellare ATCC 36951]
MSKKFVPRERKHRKLARQSSDDPRRSVSDHANATEIIPLSKSEKEERRRNLQEEIKAQQPDKINSKKRKRLDKYIDTKLRKEENQDLIKKLSQQQAVDPSLLQSSRKLGRVHESKRERLHRAIKEREAGISDGDDILFEKREVAESPTSDLEPEDNVHATEGDAKPTNNGATFGIGLKRPLDTNEEGRPVIKRRKRRKQAKELSPDPPPSAGDSSSEEDQDGSEAESEWEGFGSDDDDGKVREELSSNEEQESSEGSANETDDEAEEDDNEDDSEDEAEDEKPGRVSAFKAWADSQRNEAVGFTPSAVPVNNEAAKAAFKPRAPSPDPAAAEIMSTVQNGHSYRPQAAVTIPRSEEVQSARIELPVVQEEQKIMEAIHNNSVSIVCGATGSGKTTQLPQMLLENGYGADGIIGITQPRRVAAVSVASRVSHELGAQYGKQVAYQVRYDSNVGFGTKIKFMTDGILLREISQDFALSKYSVIVIDEAHERSVNTDILIGMLSRIVPLRHDLSKEEPKKYKPLKLVIMSATLRVADFLMNARLFKSTKPPIVQAEGRQYPVTEHFARRTQRDFVEETVRKVSRGHRKLPPGSILVFLTGQDEIQTVAKKLKEEFANSNTGFVNSKRPALSARQSNDYLEKEEEGDDESDVEITGLDDYDDAEDAEFDDVEPDPALPRKGALKAQILPLYAALPADQQMRVFKPTPEGSRSIVLATNVAETSLTIPGVRYVFDCGRSKEKRYDTATGVQEFKIDWISKASASQRMGRAGRTGPGHCYRLYSSAIYEQYFEEHTLPEILRTPIEGTVLQLKTMNVDNVVNFPFPTPPQGEQLAQAERLLKNIGAINPSDGKVTEVGQELIHYPVNPRFGKMLLLGLRNNVLAYTIALVAGLAVGDLFIPEPQALSSRNGNADDEDEDNEDQDILNSRKQAYGRAQKTLSAWDDKADVMKLLTTVAAYAQVEAGGTKEFCAEYYLREKGMNEVQLQRRQLHNIMQNRVKDPNQAGVSSTTSLSPPSQKEINLLKQLVAAGYIDHVAIRGDKLPNAASRGRKPTRAGEVPYRTLLPSIAEVEIDRTASPSEQEEQRSVYVHGSSVLARLSPREMPDYVVYSHLSRREGQGGKNRTRMHALTTVGPKQLAALAEGTPLLEMGKPLGKIEDRDGGRRRECWVRIAVRDPHSVGEGFPLAPWKVLQVRKGGVWVIEKVLDRGR